MIGRCFVHGNRFSALPFLLTSLKVCYEIVFIFNIYKSHIVKDKWAEKIVSPGPRACRLATPLPL